MVEITFTKKAFADIDRITEFNERRNQSNIYSRKFLTGLNKRLNKLSKHPLAGRRTDQENELLLVWDRYYVFYEYSHSIIVIKSIYHQKEDAF